MSIEFTKIKHDSNGNPRYVCHYTYLLTESEKEFYSFEKEIQTFRVIDNMTARYRIAVKRANKIGGRKFHNKQYGGGIVFQSYNIADTEASILEAVAKAL